MSDIEKKQDEEYYEKLMLNLTDKKSHGYRKAYRKLYYLRNAENIKQYQRAYYKRRREGLPSNRVKKEKKLRFRIIKKDIVIHFE